MSTIAPTEHDKNEWVRFAQAAYSIGRNDIGTRYSVAASLPRNATIETARFDSLQENYRAWLVFNEFPQEI